MLRSCAVLAPTKDRLRGAKKPDGCYYEGLLDVLLQAQGEGLGWGCEEGFGAGPDASEEGAVAVGMECGFVFPVGEGVEDVVLGGVAVEFEFEDAGEGSDLVAGFVKDLEEVLDGVGPELHAYDAFDHP